MKQRLDYINEILAKVDGYAPAENIAKHVKMASDPFLFFRGSSQLFYADIKAGILPIPKIFEALPLTNIMGDCHLSNFGFFTEEGSHGDSVIFAPNDFDDACFGYAIWDVARFLVSIVLAAKYGQKVVSGKVASDDKYLEKSSVSESQVSKALFVFVDTYLLTCRRSSESAEVISTALTSFPEEHILNKPLRKALRRAANGIEFTDKSSLAKAVDWHGSNIKFKDKPGKFKRVSTHLYEDVIDTFSPYVDDKILDVIERLGAGTGSLNLSRYYLLVGPNTFSGVADLPLCHIVEVKQQRKAAPLYHFADLSANNRLNPAHLTIQCQRRMQRSADLVLDEVFWNDEYWLVRSRHHAKVGIDPEDIVIGKKASQKGGFNQYSQACGHALALAHCRGDRRSTRFEKRMHEVLSKNKEKVIEMCVTYSHQVAQDTECLRKLLVGTR